MIQRALAAGPPPPPPMMMHNQAMIQRARIGSVPSVAATSVPEASEARASVTLADDEPTQDVEALLRHRLGLKEPPEMIADKMGFMFNNLSIAQLWQRAEELAALYQSLDMREGCGYDKQEFVKWLAFYMTITRACREANYQPLYVTMICSLSATGAISKLHSACHDNATAYLALQLDLERQMRDQQASQCKQLVKNAALFLSYLSWAREIFDSGEGGAVAMQSNSAVSDQVTLASGSVVTACRLGWSICKQLAPYLEPRRLVALALKSEREDVVDVVIVVAVQLLWNAPRANERAKAIRKNRWLLTQLSALKQVHALEQVKLNSKFAIESLFDQLRVDFNDCEHLFKTLPESGESALETAFERGFGWQTPFDTDQSRSGAVNTRVPLPPPPAPLTLEPPPMKAPRANVADKVVTNSAQGSSPHHIDDAIVDMSTLSTIQAEESATEIVRAADIPTDAVPARERLRRESDSGGTGSAACPNPRSGLSMPRAKHIFDEQHESDQTLILPTDDDLNCLAQFFDRPTAAPLPLDDLLSTPLHLLSRDELLDHYSAARRRWEMEREEMKKEAKELRRKLSVYIMRQQHVADLRWKMQQGRDAVAVAQRASQMAIRTSKESARLSIIETTHHMNLAQTLYGRTPEQSAAARRERRRFGWQGTGPHVVLDMPTLFVNGLAVKTTAREIYNRLRTGYGGRETYTHVHEIWLRPVEANSVTALVAFSSLKTARRLLRARPLFLHNCQLKFHYIPGTGNNYRWAEEVRRRQREENNEEGEVQSDSDDDASSVDEFVAPPKAVALPATANGREKKTPAQKNAQRTRKRKARTSESESRPGPMVAASVAADHLSS